MSKLKKQLDEWVSQQFINKDQAKAIFEFEEAKPSQSWVLYSFLTLGAVVISIGIISLIASNWKNIPDSMKIAGDFTFMGILGFSAFSCWNKGHEVAFEVLLLVFMLFILASIGLISQVYHTGGELYQALMLWSLITAGVAFVSQKFFVPYIWAGAFLGSLTFTLVESPLFLPIFYRSGAPILMWLPLLAALMAIGCRNIAGEVAQTKAFRSISLSCGIFGLILIEARLWTRAANELNLVSYIPGYILLALCLYGIMYSKEYREIQKRVLYGALVFYIIPFHFPLFGVKAEVAYAAFTILTLSTIAIFLASLGERKKFQYFITLVGLRFLILYFEALGSLAQTGFGLIISGLIIIGLVSLWNKYRRPFSIWAEGLVND